MFSCFSTQRQNHRVLTHVYVLLFPDLLLIESLSLGIIATSSAGIRHVCLTNVSGPRPVCNSAEIEADGIKK